MGKPNLILTGFMGTGKSSVARTIAAQTGRPGRDFDAELVAHFGRPIAQVFAEEGEATFRAAEATLCRELVPDAGLVIATGGGAAVDPTNRAALQARGILICLTADPATLLARLLADGVATRPLLGSDPAALRRLWESRAAAYAAIPWHVDTTGLTVPQVTAAVLAVYARAAGSAAYDFYHS